MSTKKGRYGNPAKRRRIELPGEPPSVFGDLLRRAQPTGISDPRTLGGNMVYGGESSRAKNNVVLDMTDVVLTESFDVAKIEIGRRGVLDQTATYLLMHGRVNQTDRNVSVGFVLNTDGVAGMVTELLALADRDSAELLDDVTRRLTELHQGKHVDLYWLRAAIDNAIALQDDTS